MIDYTITYLKAQKLEKLYWTIVQKNVTSRVIFGKFLPKLDQTGNSAVCPFWINSDSCLTFIS
jgi:hypothetical protein